MKQKAMDHTNRGFRDTNTDTHNFGLEALGNQRNWLTGEGRRKLTA
jgi:hypothetical protein